MADGRLQIETTLEEFLRTGKLDNVDVGIDSNTLFNLLGHPDEEQLRQIPRMKISSNGWFILYYKVSIGYMEFYFAEDGRLAFFKVTTPLHPSEEEENFEISWLQTLFSMDVTQLKSFADKHGIEVEGWLREDIRHSQWANVIEVTFPSSGIDVIFEDEVGKEIYSVSRSNRHLYLQYPFWRLERLF